MVQELVLALPAVDPQKESSRILHYQEHNDIIRVWTCSSARCNLKPEVQSLTNGIDFIFSEQNHNLNCKVCFTKVTISEAADATSRLATAEVATAESGLYDNVWFQYENNLLEVLKVNGDVVTCKFVEEDDQENIQLPLGLVKELVARFGN